MAGKCNALEIEYRMNTHTSLKRANLAPLSLAGGGQGQRPLTVSALQVSLRMLNVIQSDLLAKHTAVGLRLFLSVLFFITNNNSAQSMCHRKAISKGKL